MSEEHGPGRAWLASYAELLRQPAPTDEEFAGLLELAAVAAHASERVAAPVACWLAGRAGLDLTEAITAASVTSAP